ncbi:MAG: hypothetical protein IT350_14275 [Deltaproteobacteria bacterium]|nr:hypothetical protein [Deltaproteobacteria bacterium]
MTRHNPPASSLPEAWAALPLALFAANALAHWVYTMDDAFIFLRFGENLAAGNGYAFNPGETLEGTTSILWTLVAALLAKLGLVGPSPLKAIGFLAGAATVMAVYWRPPGATRGVGSLVASLLLAAYVPFAILSVSGMETPLAALCVLMGCVGTLAAEARRRRVGALWFALAFLARPDAAIWWALPLGLWTFDIIRARDVRSRVEPIALLVATLAAVTAWRWFTFGDVVPNPAHIKASVSADTLAKGIAMMGAWLRAQGMIVAVAAALIAAALRAAPRALALTTLLFGAYLVAIGQENMSTFFRFHMPVAPVVFSLAGAGAARMIAARPRVRFAVVSAILAFALGGAWTSWQYLTKPLAEFQLTVTLPEYGHGVNETYRAFGEELARIAPPGALVASMDVGAIGYDARRPILDLYGLNDRAIAVIFGQMKRTPERDTQRALYRAYADEVFARAPDYFVDTWIPKIIRDDERFAHCYAPVALSRDYVFDPRAGNRVGLFRRMCP